MLPGLKNQYRLPLTLNSMSVRPRLSGLGVLAEPKLLLFVVQGGRRPSPANRLADPG